MLEFVLVPAHPIHPARGSHPASRQRALLHSELSSETPLEARVKRECAELYPGIDSRVWYQVVMNGEYKDDLEGFWIQVEEWVTYVLTKHFDVQARTTVH